jgi:germination protein M
MRTSLSGLSKRAWVVGLVVLLLAAIAVAAAVTVFAAGREGSSDVGDGGIVSTTEGSESGEPPDSSTTTMPADTPTTQAADTMTVRVYFSSGEKIAAATRVIPKTKEVGAASMKALLEGPTEAEKNAGMFSSIPEGTTFPGLEIENGVAAVDLSKEYESGGGSLSMFMRLAQVVFTLTQFPTVDGVNFKLDGEPIDVLGGEGIIIDHPMTRADYEDMSPAILVESPTLGATVSSPLRVTGTANVFEAVFAIDVVDSDGLIIAEQRVMASSGTGTRGTFDVTIPFTLHKTGPGSLIVFSDSPKDGSQINVVETPLVFEK